MTQFRVQLPKYFGPIDLLVELVRAQELRILDVGLADIAAAFLRHFEEVGAAALEEAGDFIVPLATLLEFKSKELVPTPTAEEAFDPSDAAPTDLVRQLLEYRRFREAAALLMDKATERQNKHARGVDELADAVGPADRPIREIELWDLVSAFSRLMRENIIPVADEIAKDPTPLTEYMERLEAAVLAAGPAGTTFVQLFGQRNAKVQLIGKFLALLELIKANRVWVEMRAADGELAITAPRTIKEAFVDPSAIMADETAPPEFLREAPGKHDGMATPDHAGESPPPTDRIDPDNVPDSPPPPKRSAWHDFEPLVE